MIRRNPVVGGPTCSFEVPIMQGNRAYAMKAAFPKKTVCRADHDLVNPHC
jgi:hypothetical protein